MTDTAATVAGAKATERTGIFYGWWVIAGVFVMLAVSSGLGFYFAGVLIHAIHDDYGFSVGLVSGAVGLMFVASGITGWRIGGLLATHDPRWVITLGTLVAGAAMASISLIHSTWQLFVVFAIFGVGIATSSLVPGTTLVTRWFNRRRSVALSVASTGLSLGGILLTPQAEALVDRSGLRHTAPFLGLALVVGIVPVTLLLVRPDPASMGLFPDGDPNPPRTDSRAAAGWAFEEARATRYYQWMVVAYLFVMISQVGGIQHLFNLADERVGHDTARLSVPVLAASSVIGRLSGGWIVTRLDTKSFTTALLVVQALALGLISTLSTSATLLAATAFLGLSVGNLLMLQPLLLAEAYGVRDYGRIYGFAQLLMTLGVGAGPVLVGQIHDRAGGYQPAFLIAVLASCVAIFLFVGAGRPVADTADEPPA